MQKFHESFSKMVNTGDTLILAVSGGVDSMVLLDLILVNHPKEKIVVAHFDHSLRGEESDADREFIAKICKSENLRFESEKLDIASLAETEKMSIESAARKYRYDFLYRIREKYEARYILTAHHADDRIETAVFNLIRGSKLGGIHALGELSGYVLRPLLHISKGEILEYAKENNITYREDSTNASSDYQRNYLRHEVLPKFEKINPEYRKSLENFIEYTDELKEWIDSEVRDFLSDPTSFSVSDFEKRSPFFQKEIIRYLYEEANDRTVGLSEGNIEELLRFILTANGGTEKKIGKLSLKKKQRSIQIM